MNRYGFALIALALVVLLLALAFCNVPVEAQDSTPTPTPVCIDVYWDGHGEACGHATIEPTHTPTPSSTPSPTATYTPTATSTPPETPVIEPSPTPELTPLPDCVATTTANLNVRIVPWGDVVHVLMDGTEIYPDAKWLSDGVWWWHTMVSPTKNGYVSGNYLAFAAGSDCSHVPDLTPVTTREPALLAHGVPNMNAMRMQTVYDILQWKGIECGIKIYGDMNICIQALEADCECIYRHPNMDCPQEIGHANPQESARAYAHDYDDWNADVLRGYAKAYLEITNECYMGDDNHPGDYVWWAEWMWAYMDYAEEHNYPKLVMPTLGPGHGSLMMFQAWKEPLTRLASMGGLFGEHAYTPYHDEGLCACDKWLACRHRTNEELRQSIGLDIDVAITEAARGWGNDPVDVDDFVCYYEHVRQDEYVHSVALWTMGLTGYWPLAQLDDYMIPIVNGVQARN